MSNEKKINTYSIYRLISPSGKFYIGFTKNCPKLRFRQHITAWRKWAKDGRNRSGGCTKLYYGFDSYDPSEWSLDVIYQSQDREDCLLKEDEFIQKFDTINEGYNLVPGGFGGRKKKLTEEHRKKLSEARKRYWKTDAGKEWKEQVRKLAKENDYASRVKDLESWNKGKTGLVYKRKTPDVYKIFRPDGTSEVTDHMGLWCEKERFENHESAKKNLMSTGFYGEYLCVKVKKGVNPDTIEKPVKKPRKSQLYNIQTPNGDLVESVNLRKWCIDNFNSISPYTNLKGKGYWKGYTARRLL